MKYLKLYFLELKHPQLYTKVLRISLQSTIKPYNSGNFLANNSLKQKIFSECLTDLFIIIIIINAYISQSIKSLMQLLQYKLTDSKSKLL